MDIKDFILIGGGLLIAAVVAHGFWIAWRARREPFRLDIVPDIAPDDVDDITRLRGELPNGGARVIGSPEQVDLELEPPPLLLEPTECSDEELFGTSLDTQATDEPRVDEDRLQAEMTEAEMTEAHAAEVPTDGGITAEARVADVVIPADEPKRPRRLGARREAEPTIEPAEPAVEEILVVHLLAMPDAPFTGHELLAALRARGLKYGDMNIFHSIDPLSKVVQFSVANAVEPGYFDLAEMDAFASPGVTLFLQLPGPESPGDALEEMIRISRELALELGGELKDENMSVLTGQTVEHYRQRIADFSRRRLSKRA